MIEEMIKKLLREQNKRVKDLCEHIGMTDAGLRKIYGRDSCEMSTLRKIADFFGVSPSLFFGEQGIAGVSASNESIAVGGNASNVNTYTFKVLEDLVAEIAAQRRLTERAIEQAEVLVKTIENLSKKG